MSLALSVGGGLVGCDVEDPPAPWLECVDEVCEVLPSCAPIRPGGSWDWRTRDTCRNTMSCGDREAVCKAAVAALPCLGTDPNPSQELVEEHVRAIRDLQAACRPLPPDSDRETPTTRNGGGARAPFPVKPAIY